MELNLEVKGLKELEKSMRELGREYSDPRFALKAIRPAMRKSLAPLENEIRNSTPVDTGTLRDSTKTRIRKSNNRDKSVLGQDSIMVGEVGWTWRKGESLLKQALAVEFGNKVTTARPTLRPALMRNAQSIVNSFAKELKISIDKKAKQLSKKHRVK